MHPVSVFFDFESTLKEVNEDGKYQKHIVNSVGYKFNCIHPEHSEPLKIIQSSNPDEVISLFIEELERLAHKSFELTKINNFYNEHTTEAKAELQTHYKVKLCQDCNCNFTEDNKKVLHHDHISGRYISSLCSKCNLNYTYQRFLPVYAHNLKGYDGHFIVPALAREGEIGEVQCIPNNEEKYIAFTKRLTIQYETKEKNYNLSFDIRFIDTFAHLASSLENLAANLKSGSNDIISLRQKFKNVSLQFEDDKQFLLMIEKGVYPYDYITDYSVLSQSNLPARKKFNSTLTNSKCSKADYKKALLVWDTFNCKSLLDYHNVYLTSDVLLLTDIWDNYRQVCHRIYQLDVAYYYTAPSLSWDAFLKHKYDDDKKFHIELISDMDMYLFVENNIRGGLSQISKRHAKANHPALKDYDANKELEYLLYLDANNLYGYSMSQYLPQKNFKWNLEEWTEDKIMKLTDTSPTGYLFEVDLEYPKELHDLHNGYPLAPEKLIIKNDMLNIHQQENRKETSIDKLTTSFYDKIKYGVSYRLLKLYLQLGLKLVKVHRVLEYTQSNFMESYIVKNTEERKNAKNDFEKDFYKLMNNSVYGKTMENVRNRINFRLISTEEEAMRILNRKKKHTIFNDNCVGVHLLKREVKLNKPIFIGQAVLDQSKHLMYDFHYNFMLKKIERENIDLLFTDTDSLCYSIRNQNPYEIIKQNKNVFDLSAYPKDHELYDATNKKVIGKFKDEAIDGEMRYITEFIGLKSKCYDYTTDDGQDHKRCKGIKRYVIKQNLNFETYKDVLLNKTDFIIKQNLFRTRLHQIYTETVNKIALSHRDDKVFILNDGVNCLSLGHYKTKDYRLISGGL